jgi:hypothetical protein
MLFTGHGNGTGGIYCRVSQEFTYSREQHWLQTLETLAGQDIGPYGSGRSRFY